jgi:serine/threonine protein kinase/tetratricopeptide (TPR) repeat protein
MPDVTLTGSADRNLLFGILAVQMDFITRDQLVTGMNAWLLAKGKSLGQILDEQGALGGERRTLLDALVEEHLKRHGGDPQQSLAAVSLVGSVRQQLEQLADAEVQATLTHVSSSRPGDGEMPATLPYAVGDTTLPGQRFRILRPHARGGLGEVFVALDQELHREVALKQIQERHADDADSRGRFVLEAEITGGLEHPGIVPVYGLGQYADGRPFYAMRFIKGDSLKDAIAQFHEADVPGRDPGERSLTLRKLLGRFVDVCNAIGYAHSRGVLHRDLKPGNIMLGHYGETLVVDWGLAKAVGRQEQYQGVPEATLRPSSASGSAETLPGAALGTPAFMSPEQAAGKLDLLGPASDVYSLGATLYCMLTGRAPYEGTDLVAIVQRVQRGQFVSPRQVRRSVPAALDAVCRKAMARQPEGRYGSARALAEDLEHWLADEPVAACRESLWERTKRLCRHRPVYAAGMGFIAAMDLLILGAVVGMAMGRSAVAFLPFAVLGGMVGVGIALLFCAQLWWLLGAALGAIVGSRGAITGGLNGMVAGGLLVPLISRITGPRLGGAGPSLEMTALPLVGTATGAVLGMLLVALWTRRKRRMLLGALVGSVLGLIGGNLAVAALLPAAGDHGLQNMAATLAGMMAGAVAGAALGTIAAGFPGNVTRTAAGLVLGALTGAVCGVGLAACVTNGSGLIAFLIVGGLGGAALGTFIAACLGDGRRAARNAWVGGRVGLAGGTILLTLLFWYGMHGFSGNTVLSWLALPAILAPLVLEISFGLMQRVRWEGLLTRATRGTMVGAVLGGAVVLTLPWVAMFASGPGGAADAYQPLIAMQEKLAHENPKVLEHTINLAAAYTGQGTLAREQGHAQKALALYDKAIATLQAAARQEPRNVKAREALRTGHAGRAETLARLNRHGDAMVDWDRALELDTWPDHAEYSLQRALTLARLGEHGKAVSECEALARRKNLPGPTLFTLARIYARSASAVGKVDLKGPPLSAPERAKLGNRYAARAVELLVEADAAGYFRIPGNGHELKTAADFDALRSRADFNGLAARLP